MTTQTKHTNLWYIAYFQLGDWIESEFSFKDKGESEVFASKSGRIYQVFTKANLETSEV